MLCTPPTNFVFFFCGWDFAWKWHWNSEFVGGRYEDEWLFLLEKSKFSSRAHEMVVFFFARERIEMVDVCSRKNDNCGFFCVCKWFFYKRNMLSFKNYENALKYEYFIPWLKYSQMRWMYEKKWGQWTNNKTTAFDGGKYCDFTSVNYY